MQFIFYMGWLKVAESLMNPFGDDDDDFEVSSMIDKNLQMSYVIVDFMHDNHPELLKDQFWNDMPRKLPGGSEENLSTEEPTREQDIIDYEIIRRRSTFGRYDAITIVPKDRKPKEVTEDVEVGQNTEVVNNFFKN